MRQKVWPFIFHFVQNAAFASASPFVVLYYQNRGFSGPEIGLLTGLAPLMMLVFAPLWTGYADITRRHRLMMALSLGGLVACVAIIPVWSTFVPLLLTVIILNAFAAPMSGFTDAATLAMLGNRKELYGRIRLGATLGFGLVAPLAGMVVQAYGLKWAFWGSAIWFGLALLVSLQLSYGNTAPVKSAGGSLRQLLVNPRWQLFLLLALGGGLATSVFNNYLFPLMKELKADETTMGFALTIGTIAEVPVMFFGNVLVRKLRPYGLLLVALTITGLRLLGIAASGSATLILFLQLLHGLTFSAMWIAGVAYADEQAPAGLSATAQGMFGTMVFGVGSALGGFLGGTLLEALGGRGLFVLFGSILLAAVAFVAVAQRQLSAKPTTANS